MKTNPFKKLLSGIGLARACSGSNLAGKGKNLKDSATMIQNCVACAEYTMERFMSAAIIASLFVVVATPILASTPMAGINSSSKFLIYYGDDFSQTNMNMMTNFNVVVIDINVGNCLPSSVAYLQTNGVKYVLGYISIGEEPSSVAPLPGNGNGPVYYTTNGTFIYESNGYASFYVDQEWNGSNYVSDGVPDTNVNFGGRYIWPDSDWQWVIQNQRIGGSTDLPTRSLAGLAQLMGARSSNSDSNRNDNFGLNGVFLDTLDTAGPYVDTYGYYSWTAQAMQQTVEYIRDTYPSNTVFANRGEFFYDPTLLNTTFNIHPYDFNIRPYVNGALFESFTLDSNSGNPTNSPYLIDNEVEYAPKIDNEANRSDGFTMFCLDYQMDRSNSWYAQAVLNSVVSNGWVEYESPDGSLATIGSYTLTNLPPADTAAPVWDSTAANSDVPVPPRIGIQTVAAGPSAGSVDMHWDVARDQTPPVYYNIQCSTNAAFTNFTVYSNVVFGIGDGWAEDPTIHFANKYTLTGLPLGTNYFRVRAHDSTASKYEETNTVALSVALVVNELCNPVTTNIVVDGNLGDWQNLQPFNVGSNGVAGSGPVNWVQTWMAHNLTQFYIAFTNSGPVTINSAVNIYFDTDADRGTGFRGGGDNFPIGAEYLLQGNTLYAYTGTGITWSWSTVGTVEWSVSGNNAECSIPRKWLANASETFSNIKMIFYGDNPSVGGTNVMTMPNNAIQVGGGGGFLTYRMSDLMNPVTTNITVNGNLSDWVPYQSFGASSQIITNNNTVDIVNAWMAHNTNLFYIGFSNYTSLTYDSRFSIYFDTDANRGTGFRGTGNNLPIGADYRVNGTNVQKYTGTGLNNSWSNVTTVTHSTVNNMTELSFPQSSIGNPTLINIAFVGSNSTTSVDYYPQYASNIGGWGQFFTYRVTDISNPVTNGAIQVDGNLSDWAALIPFGTDPQDATGPGDQLDWGTSWMANDATNFYFAYANYTTISSINEAWNTYLDTDANRLTGYRDANGDYPIGADYLIQGTTLYQYTGDGTTWSWSSIGSVTYSWGGANAEISVARSLLGNPSLVKVFYEGNNPVVGGTTIDFSPDTVLQMGGGGAFYVYRTK